MKRIGLLLLSACFLLALALPALGNGLHGTLTDVYTDANTITSVTEQSLGGTPEFFQLIIHEDYNETYLVPYPDSHDGWAVVNAQGQYFDKIVQGPYTRLTFIVTNTGPYTWSDYHFEFYSGGFVNPATPDVTGRSNIFTNQEYPYKAPPTNKMAFWAPGWVASGETVTFDLNFAAPLMNTLYIRQIATTAPLPPAALLLGSGFAILAGLRRKLRP